MKPIPLISTLLTVAFVVMKVSGNLAWSWAWVLAPLWGLYCLKIVLHFVGIWAMNWTWKNGNALDRMKLLQQGYVPKGGIFDDLIRKP